jgi:hypothetical protein
MQRPANPVEEEKQKMQKQICLMQEQIRLLQQDMKLVPKQMKKEAKEQLDQMLKDIMPLHLEILLLEKIEELQQLRQKTNKELNQMNTFINEVLLEITPSEQQQKEFNELKHKIHKYQEQMKPLEKTFKDIFWNYCNLYSFMIVLAAVIAVIFALCSSKPNVTTTTTVNIQQNLDGLIKDFPG